MKLRVGADLLELDEAIAHPTLRDLKYLARESKKDGCAVTARTIQDLFLNFQKRSEEGTFDSADLLSDPDVLSQLQGLVWLARRHAGEDLTFDAAGDFDLTTFAFIDDSEDVEAPKGEETAGLV